MMLALWWKVTVVHLKTDSAYIQCWVSDTMFEEMSVCTMAVSEILIRYQLYSEGTACGTWANNWHGVCQISHEPSWSTHQNASTIARCTSERNRINVHCVNRKGICSINVVGIPASQYEVHIIFCKIGQKELFEQWLETVRHASP